MENTSVTKIEEKETLEKEGGPLVVFANELVIKTHEDNIEAQNTVAKIKAIKKRILGIFQPIKDAQHKAWRVTCDTINALSDPLDSAEKTLKKKVTTYTVVEEQKREKAAELLEAKRKDDERKRQEELEERAKKAEDKGKVEKAETLREQKEVEAPPPPAYLPPAPEQAKGTSFRSVWKADVTSVKDLCKAVADGTASVNLVLPNTPALNAFAKATKGGVKIPGVRFYEDRIMSSRSK